MIPSLDPERLELLKEAVPRLTLVAYVWNPANPGGDDDVRAPSASHVPFDTTPSIRRRARAGR